MAALLDCAEQEWTLEHTFFKHLQYLSVYLKVGGPIFSYKALYFLWKHIIENH
jgi:hypothetical protein